MLLPSIAINNIVNEIVTIDNRNKYQLVISIRVKNIK